jgi:hypothetical protein
MGDSQKRLSRWYFGGIASAGAACCTHPLDLLKVNLLINIITARIIPLVSLIVELVNVHN